MSSGPRPDLIGRRHRLTGRDHGGVRQEDPHAAARRRIPRQQIERPADRRVVDAEGGASTGLEDRAGRCGRGSSGEAGVDNCEREQQQEPWTEDQKHPVPIWAPSRGAGLDLLALIGETCGKIYADLARSRRRNRCGGTPYARLNWAAKWLWSQNRSVWAMSASDVSPASISFARTNRWRTR